jgi:hypothetical protein
MFKPEEVKNLSSVTLQFLQRVQINGNEVDNFVTCRNFLTMLGNGNLTVVPVTMPPPGAVPVPPPGAPAPRKRRSLSIPPEPPADPPKTKASE